MIKDINKWTAYSDDKQYGHSGSSFAYEESQTLRYHIQSDFMCFETSRKTVLRSNTKG